MPTNWLDAGADTVVLDYTDNIFTAKGDYAVDRFAKMARFNEEDPNQHWFESGAMSFFNTRLHRGTRRVDTDDGMVEYFVTSDRPDPRFEWRYTIRGFNWDTGRVATIGEMRAYSTFDYAWEEIECL